MFSTANSESNNWLGWQWDPKLGPEASTGTGDALAICGYEIYTSISYSASAKNTGKAWTVSYSKDNNHVDKIYHLHFFPDVINKSLKKSFPGQPHARAGSTLFADILGSGFIVEL
jgi:hypothetical protein